MDSVIKAPLRSWESAHFDLQPEMTVEEAIISLARACLDAGAIHIKDLEKTEPINGTDFWARFLVDE